MVKTLALVKTICVLCITTGLLCLRDRLFFGARAPFVLPESGSLNPEKIYHEERSSVQDSRTWVEA